MRVLNELISDMEELFAEERFRDVEKIKTIGSCLMAASGLNVGETVVNEQGTPEHVYALLDFCLALLNKLALFNSNMLSFEFTMAIGYNIGQVAFILFSFVNFDFYRFTILSLLIFCQLSIKGHLRSGWYQQTPFRHLGGCCQRGKQNVLYRRIRPCPTNRSLLPKTER